MKVVTWNVNGIRARAAEVCALIERERPDVVALQELKAAPAQVPDALSALDAYAGVWHGARAYSGVALLVRRDWRPDPPRFGHPAFDAETRIVTAELGDALTVASVYVPNGGKDFPAKLAFLGAMARYAAELHAAGERLCLLGDLNVTRSEADVHPKERDERVIGQRPEERALLRELLDAGVVDLGRALDPENDRLFTWWAPWRSHRQKNIGWRLDYVLASEPLARGAGRCAVLAAHGTSDHAPVVATLAADRSGASGAPRVDPPAGAAPSDPDPAGAAGQRRT
jgi:exodeoxyribonuclease-3